MKTKIKGTDTVKYKNNQKTSNELSLLLDSNTH